MAEMLAYIEQPSVIHRLSGASKLLLFIMWSTAAMLTYDTRVLLFLFIASLIIFKISKIRFADIRFVLLFILLFLLLNNIAIYLFSPQEGVKIYGTSHVIFDIIGRYNVTYEQIFYQLNITLKYFAVIPAALLFIVTTHPSEFAASLNKIGVPYKISYSVSLALRYIPDVQRDFRTIAQAQQARGIDLSSNEKWHKRVRNASSIIFPLILSSMDRIETISNAMELRAFGKKPKRTWYSSRAFEGRDYIAIGAGIIILIASLVITFYDGSRFYNPFN